MTDESLQLAAKLMADAYRAGYDGHPMPEAHKEHATLQHQFALGRHHSEAEQRSDFWVPYGIGRHGRSLSV